MFPTKAYFVLIPHSALHLVEEVSIDLAIDTLSFAEMPPSAIAATPILSPDTSAKWASRQPAPFDYAQGEDETYRASPGGRCPIRSTSP
jgi:hypothetical protein